MIFCPPSLLWLDVTYFVPAGAMPAAFDITLLDGGRLQPLHFLLSLIGPNNEPRAVSKRSAFEPADDSRIR